MTTAPSRTTSARIVRTLLALLVAAAACLTLASPASAGTVEDEGRLFDLQNQARAGAGLAALQYDPAAVGVARAWAQELARSGQLRHNPNLVAQVDGNVTNQWTRVGENVGYAPDADTVFQAYMNSSGHRANILGDYNRVGVGAARDANNRLWTAVVFLKAPGSVAAATTPPPPPPPAVPASTFAPLSSAPAFVAQQFADLLGRQPDGASMLNWTAALNAGSASPAAMVGALVDSPESAMVVAPVNRLYWAYFHRQPDAAGMQYWVNRLRAGVGLGQVSYAFAASPEFAADYGSLGDGGFVDLVYRNVLSRPADGGGLAYWSSLLASGRLDRGAVMIGFSESPEFRSATRAWNAVVQVYLGMLHRAPDQAALDYWIPAINAGRPVADLAATVLASDEYAARF